MLLIRPVSLSRIGRRGILLGCVFFICSIDSLTERSCIQVDQGHVRSKASPLKIRWWSRAISCVVVHVIIVNPQLVWKNTSDNITCILKTRKDMSMVDIPVPWSQRYPSGFSQAKMSCFAG
jgi:hypothetical protein